jgi:hypothetical protein
MPARPLSPQEIEEVQNMIAECDLNPDRLRVFMAELIRLREFAAFANRYRGRLPIKVRDAFERNVPAKSERAQWVEAGVEESIEHDIHQPDQPKQERLL